MRYLVRRRILRATLREVNENQKNEIGTVQLDTSFSATRNSDSFILWSAIWDGCVTKTCSKPLVFTTKCGSTLSSWLILPPISNFGCRRGYPNASKLVIYQSIFQHKLDMLQVFLGVYVFGLLRKKWSYLPPHAIPWWLRTLAPVQKILRSQ